MSLAVAGAAAPAPPPYMTPLIAQAQLLATHSWEWGTLSEALLEWYDPQYAVFGDDPFPNGSIPRTDPNDVEGLKYAARHIRLDNVTLVEGDGMFDWRVPLICLRCFAPVSLPSRPACPSLRP